MNLSVGQVDCKNHLSEYTIHLSEMYKPVQLVWKSEIRSRPSDMSCRYSTCPTVNFTHLRGSDEWNFEPCPNMFEMQHVCWLQQCHNISLGNKKLHGGNKIFCLRLPEEQLQNYKISCNGLVQDCSNSIANAPELLQSCTKTSP